VFIPGAIDALGVGDAGAMRIPGAVVMPGIGATVGAGDGFATMGAGVAFFAGAGVAIGIPGMGATVGSAARPGEAVTKRMKAATLKRVASKGDLYGM
jgi:hypothetical protein